MKKYLIGLIISLFFIFPSVTLAKKYTCSNNKNEAIIEIDKETFNVGDTANISISSDVHFEAKYTVDKDYISINDGLITANKDGKTSIKVETFFEDDTNCNMSIPIEITSNDSSLKLLNLEEKDISVLFTPETLNYEVNLPHRYEKINIIAEANNPNSKITGDGRRYLNEGVNEYEVIVTATDGTSTTYKIVINRDEANDDTTLQNLIVEGYILSPKFESNIYNYSLNVGKEVDNITINAEATYKFAEVKGLGSFTLATGKNIFNIIVVAENGAEGQYEIVVNKDNGDSKLKSLNIDGHKLNNDFQSDVYTYYLTINNDIKSLNINAEALDNEQIEIIGNESLNVGKNEIIIRVSGEDKSSTTYKIIVNKLSVEEEEQIQKNTILLNVLLIMFIVSVIIMVILIVIFVKRNIKINRKNNKKKKNKKK